MLSTTDPGCSCNKINAVQLKSS